MDMTTCNSSRCFCIKHYSLMRISICTRSWSDSQQYRSSVYSRTTYHCGDLGVQSYQNFVMNCLRLWRSLNISGAHIHIQEQLSSKCWSIEHTCTLMAKLRTHTSALDGVATGCIWHCLVTGLLSTLTVLSLRNTC